MKSPANVANRPQPGPASSAGFTLVEMLVAVALVVLMLMLFAQIFGDTVRIMREQQSLSQNDQKARSVESLIRSDLARMSFRQPRAKGVTGIVPLRENWPIDPDRQRGYFYISENDIENALDDVLQFTVDGRETHRAPNVVVYKGRASSLEANAFSPGAAALDQNQPDWDDGNFGDYVGESHAAEVVYFLRGGNLYRRQMLLREPRKPVDPDPTDNILPPSEFDPQPGPGPYGSNLVSGTLFTRKFVRQYNSNWVEGDYLAALDPKFAVTGVQPAFWNDFDYSAWNWWRDGIGDGNPTGSIELFSNGSDRFWLMFNSLDSLKNVPGAASYPVAMPQYRFGHRPPFPSTVNAATRLFEGMPVEYLLQPSGLLAMNAAAGETKMDAFIGRYTHEETSKTATATTPAFGYPGVVPADGAGAVINPFIHNDPTATVAYGPGWDSNKNSIIDIFEGGPRAGEDLVLANVESFDIEVWDDGYSEPDLNGNGIADPFEDRNGNGVLDNFPARWVNLGHAGYRPGTTTPQRFGFYSHTQNLNWCYGPRPVLLSLANAYGADGSPGIANYDDNASGSNDDGYEDVNGNGALDSGEDSNSNGQLDNGETGWPYSDDAWNRCYDTWHAKSTAGIGSQLVNTGNHALVHEPPFRPTRVPLRIGNTYIGTAWQRGNVMNGTGVVTYNSIIFPGHEDRNYNGVLDYSEDGEDFNRNGTLDSGEDLNGNGVLDGPNGVLDAGEDRNNNGILDGPEDRNGNGTIDSDLSYYYMPVKISEDSNGNHLLDGGEDTDMSGALNGLTNSSKEPEWPREPGATVVDGTTIWKCFDNRIGLQMMRITIRYRDPASGAPRQVSIVHSFVE